MRPDVAVVAMRHENKGRATRRERDKKIARDKQSAVLPLQEKPEA